MRFCYVDETGTHQNSPVLVFIGLMIDASKRVKMEREARDMLGEILPKARKNVAELKGHHFYSGRKHWSGVEGRHDHITALCRWFAGSQCRLAVSAIRRDLYAEAEAHRLLALNPWSAGALHVALQVQKSGSPKKRNKGSTLLVFDQQQMHQEKLTSLLLEPPGVVDEFYGRDKASPPFDQLIDTPFFVDSRRVPTIQIADLFASLVRHYIEVSDGHRQEEYDGELEVLGAWWNILSDRFLDKAARLPTKPRSALSDALKDLTPVCLHG